jgi:hypothetical protein
LGIKIMMPPETVKSQTGALIARQVLREIVDTSVKTASDEHYFTVMMHKGISADMQHMSFNALAMMLRRPTPTIHHFIAEHMISGSARGGCEVCNEASKELKDVIFEEKKKDHGSEEPFSLWIAVASIAQAKRRSGR